MAQRGGVGALAAAFGAGALVGSLWGAPLVARAAVSCTTAIVQEVRTNNNVPEQRIKNRGFKAHDSNGMYVWDDGGILCDRVSSILLKNTDVHDFIEFGYQEWTIANYHPLCAPSQHSYGFPRWFIYYFDGEDHCYPGFNSLLAISAGYHKFTIANASLDFDFDFYLDDVLKQTVFTPDFNDGFGITNMEQMEPTDPYRANFNRMQYQDGSGWHDWPNWQCFQDNTDTYGSYADGSMAHIQVDVLGDGKCGSP